MSRNLEDLHPSFRPRAEHVLAECQAQGVTMRPFFTWRSPEEQARLWRQSRPRLEIDAKVAELRERGAWYLAEVIVQAGPQYGRWATNAIPGESWHQWGLALDAFWLLDGQAVWSTRKRIELASGRDVNGYHLYAEIAQAESLTAGGYWRRRDWPHIQAPALSVRSYFSLTEIDEAMQRYAPGLDEPLFDRLGAAS